MGFWITNLLPRKRPGWFPFAAGGAAGRRLDFNDAERIAESPVAMSCVSWLMRNFTEAPLRVRRRNVGGAANTKEFLDNHMALQMLRTPGDGWSLDELLKATVYSLAVAGNAYWIKERGAGGLPVGVRYVAHTEVNLRITEGRRGNRVITYDVQVPNTSRKERVLPENIVHLRLGRDPYKTYMGLMPLRPVMPDIWADAEAYQYTNSLLHNRGVGGLIASPDPRSDAEGLKGKDLEDFQRMLKESTDGIQRGRTVAMSIPMRITQIENHVNDLVLRAIHNRAEERICAAFGMQPAVLGLGAGLEQTKVGATLNAELRYVWVNTLIPWQSMVAHDLTAQLLDEYSDGGGVEFLFDWHSVPAAREDELRQIRIEAAAQIAGLRTPNESRERLGMMPHDSPEANQLAPPAGRAPTVNVDPDSEVE